MKFCLVFILSVSAVFAADTFLQDYQNGQPRFSASLFKEVIKTKKGANALLSPFSAQTVLALTQAGAKDDTAVEMRQALVLPNSEEEIEKIYETVLPQLKGNEKYALHTANKVYVKNDYPINDGFKDVATRVFQAGFENIEFSQKERAASTINEWVEDQTNHRIKNLIEPDSLTDATRLVLVNALYFKANWSKPFDTYATNKKKFYKSAKESVDVDMMSQTSQFQYYESKELNAQILELPYYGVDASMVIVLPKEVDGLAHVEENLEKALVRPEFTYENVHVELPKFTVEDTIQLKDNLINLGMKKAFDGTADLSGIAGKKGELFIDKVIQKTFINVTESGTEAAAATAVLGVFTSAIIGITRPPPIDFIVNKPFLYYITVNKYANLFVGKVNEI